MSRGAVSMVIAFAVGEANWGLHRASTWYDDRSGEPLEKIRKVGKIHMHATRIDLQSERGSKAQQHTIPDPGPTEIARIIGVGLTKGQGGGEGRAQINTQPAESDRQRLCLLAR